MKIIKKLFTIILLIFIAFLATGCKKKNSPTPTQSSDSIAPANKEITLIWWNLFEPYENVQPVIDAYQAKYPNVKIEYAHKDFKTYRANLDSVLTDGLPESTPDIFTIKNTWIGRYSNYIMSAPADVIDTATFQKDFYPVIYNDAVLNGRIKGIPLGIDSLAIIYNKKLLQEKGYTTPSDNWNEFFEQAKNLTVKDSNGVVASSGVNIGAYDNSQFWFDIFNLLLMQANIDMVDSTGKEAIFAEDQSFLDTVNYFQQYQNEDIWNENRKQDVALFLEGKLAFFIAPSWRLDDVLKYNDAYNLGLDIGVASMPQLTSLEQEDMNWASYWLQSVSIDSKNYKVAWDFIKFASEESNLELMYNKQKESREFGQIYPRIAMKDKLQNEKYLDVYLNAINQAKDWKMVDSEQVKVVFSKLLQGKSNIATSESEITNILKRNGYLSRTN